MKEIKNKLLNSIYFEYLVQSVKNGKEAPDIYKELNEEKGYPISLPTVRDAVRFVKKNGEVRACTSPLWCYKKLS